MDPEGHSPVCDFVAAVVVEDLDEAQPKTIAIINKTATNFVNLLILDLLVGSIMIYVMGIVYDQFQLLF
jgi:hypothetical protein